MNNMPNMGNFVTPWFQELTHLNGGRYPRSDTRQTERTSKLTLISYILVIQLTITNIAVLSSTCDNILV